MKILTILLVTFFLVLPIWSQPQPAANFAGAGAGFQSKASPQASGWTVICHNVGNVSLLGASLPNYLCNANDYDGTTVSTRADYMPVLIQAGPILAGPKMGAGLSMTSDGAGGTNAGGSFDLGGWMAAKLDKILPIPNSYAVLSVSWLKQDVSSIVQQNKGAAVLRGLAERAVFRFGFGKSW